MAGTITPIAYVVTHDLGTQRFGNVNTTAKTRNLSVLILGEQIRADRISDYLKSDFFAMRADLLCTCQWVGGDMKGREVEINELDAVKAEFLRKITYINIVALVCLNVFRKAVA